MTLLSKLVMLLLLLLLLVLLVLLWTAAMMTTALSSSRTLACALKSSAASSLPPFPSLQDPQSSHPPHLSHSQQWLPLLSPPPLASLSQQRSLDWFCRHHPAHGHGHTHAPLRWLSRRLLLLTMTTPLPFPPRLPLPPLTPPLAPPSWAHGLVSPLSSLPSLGLPLALVLA